MTTLMMGKLYELLKEDFLVLFCGQEKKYPNLDIFMERIEMLFSKAKNIIEANRFRAYLYSNTSFIQL